MYRSTQTAKELIDELSDEMDVWEPFPPEWYLSFINQVEQSLYAHSLLFPEKKVLSPRREGGRMGEVLLSGAVENASPREEDIVAVYADHARELTPVSPDLFSLFPASYFVEGEGDAAKIVYRPARSECLTVYFRRRPTPKTLDNYDEEHLAIPDEYVELLKEKLRGEAFFAVGEAEEAKNHLGAYNAYLNSFLLWAGERKQVLGGIGRA